MRKAHDHHLKGDQGNPSGYRSRAAPLHASAKRLIVPLGGPWFPTRSQAAHTACAAFGKQSCASHKHGKERKRMHVNLLE